MDTFAPIVIYYLYAGVYQLLPPLDRFRLHTGKEEQKNLVPMVTVIKGVLLQQLIQATIARILFLQSTPKISSATTYSPANPPPSFSSTTSSINGQILWFIPFQSSTDEGFWRRLSSLKLDTRPRPISKSHHR
ncbi:Sphinganine C(4)-monooxygenase 1 [Platanthera guangdongensis]|uniref:Sphinganine C(4)-monooxygenase 1 n=1 Tax=Platanthera guangdongensis TaxID=2320717 RepID=A0ABR2N1R0_9ASPA